MSRYCASCGKLLADDAKFCTSCGAPVEQTTASNGQPAFEQTGFLDTPQAKPDDPQVIIVNIMVQLSNLGSRLRGGVVERLKERP